MIKFKKKKGAKMEKQNKTKLINIRIEPELKKAIEKIRQAEGKSMSAMLREYIKNKAKKIDKKNA